MHTTSLYSLNEDFIIDLELDSLVDLGVLLLEHGVKLLSLYSCSWEAVEEETLLALWL